MPRSRITHYALRPAPLAFLFLLVAAFFWEATLLRRTFFHLDIALQNYPLRHFFAEQWKLGRWPLWCPQILGGFPLLAEGQAGAAYLPNLLLYPFLKTWVALNLSVILHYALAAVGMFLLLRLWTGPWGAALAALCYALNGWMVGHLIHLNALSAAAWIPLVFYFLERTFRRGTAWNLLCAAAAVAMPFLAGHVQVALYACLAVTLFVIFRMALEWRGGHRGAAGRTAIVGVILFLFAFGLAAIQILPSRELLQHSDRSGALSYDLLTHGSVPPSLLALFFMPRLFGSQGNATHWLSGQIDAPFHELNFYLGLLPLLLAALALIRRRDPPTFFFAILLALSGLFMLGKYSPFYRLHQLVPVFDRLRMPGRYAYLVVFSLAALAGLGFDRLIPSGKEEDGKKTTTLKVLLAFAVVAVLLPLAVGLGAYRSFHASPNFSSELAVRLRKELLFDGIRSICFLALSAGLLAAFPAIRQEKRKWLAALAVLVVICDLWSTNRQLSPTIEPAYYEEPPATAKWLGYQGEEDERPGTFLNFRIYDFDRRKHPSGATGWQFRNPYFEDRETLNGCLPMSYGLASLNGHVGLYVDRWWAFGQGITANRLGTMAVRYVIGEPPRDQEWFRKIPTETPVPIYENLKAAPRAFLAKQAIPFSSMVELVTTLESPEFDPRTTVLLEDPKAPPAQQARPEGRVQFRQDDPDEIILEVESNGAAYLVLADTFFPGWLAAIDGRPTPIYRANFFARAIHVPSGEHVITFRYRPMSFRLGAWITAVFSFLGLVGCLLYRRRTPFQSAHPTC